MGGWLYIGYTLINYKNMAFRNKELVDKGFVNIKSGVKTLDLMVARGGSDVDTFRKQLKEVYNKIEELESLIEREAGVLRNG
jgi:hypothetical protein